MFVGGLSVGVFDGVEGEACVVGEGEAGQEAQCLVGYGVGVGVGVAGEGVGQGVGDAGSQGSDGGVDVVVGPGSVGQAGSAGGSA